MDGENSCTGPLTLSKWVIKTVYELWLCMVWQIEVLFTMDLKDSFGSFLSHYIMHDV